MQSSQGVSQGNILLNFDYDYNNAYKTFDFETYPCNSDFSGTCSDAEKTKDCKDPLGYSLYQSGTCPCLTCEKSCKKVDYSAYLQERTLTSGLDWVPIVWTAGVVLFIVLLSVIYRVIKSKIRSKNRRKDSIDSLYNVRAYVNQMFPDEDIDKKSEVSQIDDDQVGFAKIRGSS